MKKALLLILLSCVFFQLNAQKATLAEGLKGRVKSYQQYAYNIKPEDITSGSLPFHRAICTFDTLGNNLELQVPTHSGEPSFYSKYIIKDGKIVEINTINRQSFRTDITLNKKVIMQNDSMTIWLRTKIIKDRISPDTVPQQIIDTLYQQIKDNNKYVVTQIKNNNIFEIIEEEKYNDSGTLSESKYLTEDYLAKPSWSYTINTYDDNNLKVKVENLDINSPDSPQSVFRYEYSNIDEKGNWTEQIVLSEDGTFMTLIKREYEYYPE